MLLALTPAAQLIVFAPSDKEFKQVASYKVADSPTYAYPVVAGNRLYIKDQNSLTLWTIANLNHAFHDSWKNVAGRSGTGSSQATDGRPDRLTLWECGGYGTRLIVIIRPICTPRGARGALRDRPLIRTFTNRETRFSALSNLDLGVGIERRFCSWLGSPESREL